MKDLVEKVKRECAGAFIEGHKTDELVWGVEFDEASRLIYLGDFNMNYSKLAALFSPKPLRSLVWFPTNEMFHTYGGGAAKDLYVYHFPVNLRRLRKNVSKIFETDMFFWERLPEDKRKEKPVSIDQYMDWFRNKFGDSPALIHIGIFSYYRVIGPREVTQELMNYLKAAPNNTYDFTRAITNGRIDYAIAEDSARFKTARLYDLLSKPKEVHFNL